jgi:hypothetical protein
MNFEILNVWSSFAERSLMHSSRRALQSIGARRGLGSLEATVPARAAEGRRTPGRWRVGGAACEAEVLPLSRRARSEAPRPSSGNQSKSKWIKANQTKFFWGKNLAERRHGKNQSKTKQIKVNQAKNGFGDQSKTQMRGVTSEGAPVQYETRRRDPRATNADAKMQQKSRKYSMTFEAAMPILQEAPQLWMNQQYE